jgi:ribosomal protein S27AE
MIKTLEQKERINAAARVYYAKNHQKILANCKVNYHNEMQRMADNGTLAEFKRKRQERENEYRHNRVIRGDNHNIILDNKPKRPLSGKCTLCGEKRLLLYFHHWDDNNPSDGRWVCGRCHGAIHYFTRRMKKGDVAVYKCCLDYFRRICKRPRVLKTGAPQLNLML